MDKKMEFIEKLSARMVEWDAQIDALKYKADNAPDDVKAEYCKEIDALLRKRKEAEKKLQGFRPPVTIGRTSRGGRKESGTRSRPPCMTQL